MITIDGITNPLIHQSLTNLAGDPGLEHGGDAADYRLVIPTRRLYLEPSMALRLMLCLRACVAEGTRYML